ncbi:unnamed protein product [uncultured bacterium]|nr:unnamed protein product [uncultured bacterium]
MGNNRQSLRATITRIGLDNGYTLTVSLNRDGRTKMMPDMLADTVDDARRMAAEVARDKRYPLEYGRGAIPLGLRALPRAKA